MDQPVIAIFDANILYPAPLRDLFIRIAQTGLVLGRWSETIHDKWIRNALKDNPNLSPERLARTRELMNAAVRDCLVTGDEDLIDSLSLPDPDDRHVLAAGIRAGAAVIVTYNLKDFPAATLVQFEIQAQHPDDFLVGLLDEAPGVVCAAVKRQRESLRNPPKTTQELLAHVGKSGADAIRFPAHPIHRLALTESADSLMANQMVAFVQNVPAILSAKVLKTM